MNFPTFNFFWKGRIVLHKIVPFSFIAVDGVLHDSQNYDFTYGNGRLEKFGSNVQLSPDSTMGRPGLRFI